MSAHRSLFRSRERSRGAALIYITVSMVAMMGFCSLAVDLGRVQAAKTELHTGADAAARYGALGLSNIIYGTSAASNNAIAVAAQNLVDGSPLVLTSSDVQTGIWSTATHTFTANSNPTLCNAVQVTAHRTAARGTAIPLLFATLIGQSSCDINVTSVAMVTNGASASYTIPATSNPFLAGMPSGTIASQNNPHNSPDYAPQESPVAATGINIVPGATMTFDGINGGATNDYTDPNRYTADGNLSTIVDNTNGSENHISDIYAPINCLIGVFLSDSVPTSNTTPPTLDFSTDAERNFTTLKPQLQQIFFIGDGRDDAGSVQNFVVPAGATRLYLATMDSYQWNNNIGSFSTTIHQQASVSIVQ
jgi:hypothetical protein